MPVKSKLFIQKVYYFLFLHLLVVYMYDRLHTWANVMAMDYEDLFAKKIKTMPRRSYGTTVACKLYLIYFNYL